MGRTVNESSEIVNTSFVQMPLNENTPIVSRFVSGWERSSQMFTTLNGFSEYMEGMKNVRK